MIKGIDDQAQDVRKQVRICWKAYSQVEEFSERIPILLKDMRSPAKKQLLQELGNAANKTSKTGNNFMTNKNV